nr:ATP-binding protein [Streptomyces sp. I6]
MAQLAAWELRELDGLEETVELLVSELVTNAVCHTRGPLRLNLLFCNGRLCCEVEDTSSDGPTCGAADAWAEGGRGTGLLDTLADRWGSCRTATGKTTWFELEATGDPAPGASLIAGQALPQDRTPGSSVLMPLPWERGGRSAGSDIPTGATGSGNPATAMPA